MAAPATSQWVVQANAALNGEASAQLRALARLATRRKFGAFFTGTSLSARLLKQAQSTMPGLTYDPACGMGDLLLVGTVDEAGVVEMRMSSRLHDTEFHPQPVPWADFAKNEGDRPKSGPLRFEFYFFHRGERDSPTQSLSLAQLGQFLRNNQGIRIYRDGFRVKPYGEPNGEGDWLRLGFRRTINPEGVKQGTNWRLGYNQVVGAVFLKREKNAALIDQTNREGLVMGEPFRHLYIFADKVVQFFETNHQKFEKARDAGKESPPAPEADAAAAAGAALRDLGQLAQKLEHLLTPAAPTAEPPATPEAIGKSLEQVSSVLGRAVRTLEEKARDESAKRVQTEREKNTLANLASLGILTACFGHETSGWSSTVQANAGWMFRNLKKHFYMVSPEIEEKVLQVLTDIGTDSKKLHTFAGFALGNVRPDKRRQRVFCVREVALEVFRAFEESLQQQKGITTDIEVPAHRCPIRAYRIDWESIFANLLTNAMWAVTKHQGDRAIRLGITEDAGFYTLTFEDSGFGLESGTEEQVFEAGFSTKRNNKGEQEGTGMGLFIVKSFVVENSGGTVRAIAKGTLGGASFIITVPKAEEPAEA